MAETTEQYRARINQLKTSIENEPLIKKMRDDIAEGVSKTGNRQADIEDQFKDVIEGTTGKDVISAPEIIAARKGEASLNARLTKNEQEVTAQLANKVSNVYFDSYMQSVVDWSPMGSYTTYASLVAAYPSGTSGVFLVQENGHAYSWIKSTLKWEDIGLYQASDEITGNTKVYFNFKEIANKKIENANGGIVNKDTNIITIPQGATGANSYLMYRIKIDGKQFSGKTIKVSIRANISSVGMIYTRIIANIHKGPNTLYNVGVNETRFAQSDGSHLYTTEILVTEDDTEFEVYFNVSNDVPVSTTQLLEIKEVVYEVLSDSVFETSNTLTIDAKLKEHMDISKETNAIEYNFIADSKISGSALQGTSIDTNKKTVKIPAGIKSNPYISFETPLKKHHIGNVLRVYATVSYSDNVDASQILLNIGTIRNGVVVLGSFVPVKLATNTSNQLVIFSEVLVTANDTSLIPNVQLVNNEVFNEDLELTVDRISYMIVDASEHKKTNEIMLLDTLDGKQGSEYLIYKDEKRDNLEVVLPVENESLLVLNYFNGYDVVLRAYGKMKGDRWVQLPFTDTKTRNSFKQVATVGKYVVDTSQVSEVKFVNKNSWQYATGFSASVSTNIDLTDFPIQNINYEYVTKPPETTVIDIIQTSMMFLTLHDAKLYVSAYENIMYSDDWGADGYNKLAGTVTGSGGVYKLQFMDNGNAIVWGENGKIFTSVDDLQTWTQVLDVGNALTSRSYGAKVYKQYLMFVEYNNEIDGATKAYISEDYGVTVREVFDILKQPGFEPNGIKKHTHSCAIDPYELTLDGKPMLWVCTGDGPNQQMVFYSKDFGANWYPVAEQGNAPIQSTEIIPLKNCVLFTSDARVSGVTRYNRPVTGTIEGEYLHFEMPLLLGESWGYNGLTDVPVGSTPAIDFVKSVAYFGWDINSDAYIGNTTSDTLLNSPIYVTDGYNFHEIFKEEQSYHDKPSGVLNIYLDKDENIVANIRNIGTKKIIVDI